MKTENAALHWDESDLPYSTEFEDIYYSRQGEREESRHVFIDANDLSRRWREAACTNEGDDKSFTIGELGFGAGLNFLQTWQAWRAATQRPRHLTYLGFEKHPLTLQQMQRVHRRWPELAELSEALLSTYPDHGGGCQRIPLADDITLDLYYGDAAEQLAARPTDDSPAVDCWYLDGFSPRLNPQLWQEDLFKLLARCSHRQSTLSSYSVAGQVRKNLLQAGFAVEKRPGYGKKRHMLYATTTGAKTANRSKVKPWFRLPARRHGASPDGEMSDDSTAPSAIVIGAGMAGASTANSLATRGWRVTVYDSAPVPASGASGNRQLALRCRLYRKQSAMAEFFMQAYLFSGREFAKLQRERGLDWHPCGVLQLASALNKQQAISDSDIAALYPQQLVELVSQQQASTLANAPLTESGWHLPAGGWLDPLSLCEAYLAHPNISLQTSTAIGGIRWQQGKWQVFTADDAQQQGSRVGGLKGSPIGGLIKGASADVVVIANSHGATAFKQCSALPLQILLGQSTYQPASIYSEALSKVICGQRSVFPARDKLHTLSASYSAVEETDSSQLLCGQAEHRLNRSLAAQAFVAENFFDSDLVAGKEKGLAAWRCNAADQLPIVGMVPDFEAMQSAFSPLARNAQYEFDPQQFDPHSLYLPGLYINIAHGSNGLASCPASSEYLASLINSEHIAISREAMAGLSPARFLIRDLKKQRL